MDDSQPEVESVNLKCEESMISTQSHAAKKQDEICTTASVQLALVQTVKFRLLLSLPIELRRMIYRYYFHSPSELWQGNYRRIQKSEYCNIFCLKTCDTRILSVNHQLLDEAREVLYNDTIWHFSFRSFDSDIAHKYVDDSFLHEFGSRPAFRFMQNVTIGVMFRPVMKDTVTFGALENRNRLRINRKLLRKICRLLRKAPNLRTVKLLWHDQIDYGDWGVKETCLRSLAKLPEKVRCMVFLGDESMAVHYPGSSVNPRIDLSVQEQAAKAKLNQYLNDVRQRYQAISQHKSP